MSPTRRCLPVLLAVLALLAAFSAPSTGAPPFGSSVASAAGVAAAAAVVTLAGDPGCCEEEGSGCDDPAEPCTPAGDCCEACVACSARAMWAPGAARRGPAGVPENHQPDTGRAAASGVAEGVWHPPRG